MTLSSLWNFYFWSNFYSQIWRWGGGSLRSYYKPKQMKNLYDVETGVKKDVVRIHFTEWEGSNCLFRCFSDMRILQRLWWGAGLGSPVFRFASQLPLLPSPMFPFQFGLYMSQTSLMLTPTMESWQDRELDAKTSYLMDNVKYTSRGAFHPFPPLLHFFLRSWSLLAYFSASSGHLLHDKNSAHCN